MVNFEQARVIAVNHVKGSPLYPDWADVMSQPWGSEAADYFIVIVGPYARFNTPRFPEEEIYQEAAMDDDAICVMKSTGKVVRKFYKDLDPSVDCGAVNPDIEYD